MYLAFSFWLGAGQQPQRNHGGDGEKARRLRTWRVPQHQNTSGAGEAQQRPMIVGRDDNDNRKQYEAGREGYQRHPDREKPQKAAERNGNSLATAKAIKYWQDVSQYRRGHDQRERRARAVADVQEYRQKSLG